jgi:hypothetical protein
LYLFTLIHYPSPFSFVIESTLFSYPVYRIITNMVTLSCTAADAEGKDCIARCPRCHYRATVHEQAVLQKDHEQIGYEIVKEGEPAEKLIENDIR